MFFKKFVPYFDGSGRLYLLKSPSTGKIYRPDDFGRFILDSSDDFEKSFGDSGIFAVYNREDPELIRNVGEIFEILPDSGSRTALHTRYAVLERAIVNIPRHLINAGEYLKEPVHIPEPVLLQDNIFWRYSPEDGDLSPISSGDKLYLEFPSDYISDGNENTGIILIPVRAKKFPDIISGEFIVYKINPEKDFEKFISKVVNYYGDFRVVKNRKNEILAVFNDLAGEWTGGILVGVPARKTPRVVEVVKVINFDYFSVDNIDGSFEVILETKPFDAWTELDVIDYYIQTQLDSVGNRWIKERSNGVNLGYYWIVSEIYRIFGEDFRHSVFFDLPCGEVYLDSPAEDIFTLREKIKKIVWEEEK